MKNRICFSAASVLLYLFVCNKEGLPSKRKLLKHLGEAVAEAKECEADWRLGKDVVQVLFNFVHDVYENMTD